MLKTDVADDCQKSTHLYQPRSDNGTSAAQSSRRRLALLLKQQIRSSHGYSRDDGYEKWTALFIRSVEVELLIWSDNR